MFTVKYKEIGFALEGAAMAIGSSAVEGRRVQKVAMGSQPGSEMGLTPLALHTHRRVVLEVDHKHQKCPTASRNME